MSCLWDTKTDTSPRMAPKTAQTVKNRMHSRGKKNAKTQGKANGSVETMKNTPPIKSQKKCDVVICFEDSRTIDDRAMITATIDPPNSRDETTPAI